MEVSQLLTRPEAPRVALVVNAGSRRGRDALTQARELLADAGVPVQAHAVGSGLDLEPTLDAVVATRPDLLVVGGGDGTVGAAAGRVAGSSTVLGVLPLGTANDFARTLGIPSHLPAAVTELLHGRVVDVDLGAANDRTFLNVASLGLSVGVTERLTPRLKRRLGPLAYPAATLRAYRHHQPFAAVLEFPDGDHTALALEDLMQVAVGNGRHYGGGNSISPTAGLDDDLLDVYAITRGRLRDHVSIARFLKDGTFIEHERVLHLTTRRVRVVTDPARPVNLDGEIASATPVEFSVRRNALHVAVPARSEAARLDGPDWQALATS
ncbi:lipid kinase [Nocardioides nanhaiensis]|uniref:Lipid kinase n=1 Tax=Nocardioides nanhaiensis TaxID=1476871 RepID=A0ABP8WD10_9ACTN